MNQTWQWSRSSGLAKLKLLFALSRTPHALIDMATPALAALLCLGHMPPPGVTLLGLLTVFAGYTAVYALNDVVDYRSDNQKVLAGGFLDADHYLDGAMVRHPIAQNLLTLHEGILWVAFWGVLGAVGAYTLNPACLLVFLGACLLEIIYCLMWRVSPLRTVVSGFVKSAGGIAAVLAVDPSPSPAFLLALFLWLFFWEIGGQNIPADWTDIDEDRRLNAKTIPVSLGAENSIRIVLLTLTAAILTTMVLLCLSPARFSLWYYLGALAAGAFLLLLPAYRLHRSMGRPHALVLFNRASYYPLTILALLVLQLCL